MQINARRPQTTAHHYQSNGADRSSHQLRGGGSYGEETGSGSGKREEERSDSGVETKRRENESSPLLKHQKGFASFSAQQGGGDGSRGGGGGGGGGGGEEGADPLPQSTELLGLPHLCCHYGGQRLFYVYEVGVFIYLVLTLWAVFAVFTSQLSATVMALAFDEDCSIYNEEVASHPSCQYSYYSAWALLTVLTLGWSLSGAVLSETVANASGIFRILAFLIMIGTAALALFKHGATSAASSSSSSSSSDHRSASIGALSMLPHEGGMLEGAGLAVVYAILSYNVSFDMADVFSPERWGWSNEKGKAGPSRPSYSERSPATRAAVLVLVTVAATLLFYLVISALCGAVLGSTSSLVSLNWRQYDGTSFVSSSPSEPHLVSFSTPIPWWARCLQLTILVFPVINALTSIPSLAVAQAKGLTRFVSFDPHHAHASFIHYRAAPPPAVPGGNRSIALASVLPSLLLTAITGDLGHIFLLLAPIALFIQYVLPAILLLLTRYGSNAEPQNGGRQRGGGDGRSRGGGQGGAGGETPYTSSYVLVIFLSLSLLISLATLVLLCLYPLW